MDPLTPITASLLQTPQAQRTALAEKAAQAKRSQSRRRDSADAGGDTFEHVVESAEEIAPAGRDGGSPRKRKRPPQKPPRRIPPDGEAPAGLDLTA